MNTTINLGTLQTLVLSLEQRLRDSEQEISTLKLAHTHCPSCGMRSIKRMPPREKQFSDFTLPEAVMSVLWEYSDPISARALRLRLLEKGYPQAKLGRYGNRLHTVVWRLSEGENPRILRSEGNEIIAIR